MTWTQEDKLLAIIAAQPDNPVAIPRIHAAIQAGMDWHRLYDIAAKEGLDPLLYRRCRHLQLLHLLPAWLAEDLYQSYRQTIFQNLYFLKFLKELGKNLKAYNLPVIVFKGAALLNSVYADIGLRPMEDIDLMVRPGDCYALQQILKNMGFEQDQFYPTTFKKGIIHVDLHLDLLSTHRIKARQNLTKIDLEEAWSRAVPLMDESVPLFRLALYDNLIALCLHLLKHHFSRLIWFIDIKEIIEQGDQEFDWMDLARYSWKVGVERVMLYGVLLTKHILGLRVPDDALQCLGLKHLSTIEKQILRIRLANEPMGRLSQLLYLFQIRELSQKFKFIWENIFPQKEVMAQIFPTTGRRLSPYLYIIRGLDIFLNGIIDVLTGVRVVCKKSLPRI